MWSGLDRFSGETPDRFRECVHERGTAIVENQQRARQIARQRQKPALFERQAFCTPYRLSATGQIGNDGLVVVVTNRGADTLT
jgi:hypothetical protein